MLMSRWLLPAARGLRCSLRDHPMKTKIGTHDGVFHCDEALAVSLLRSLPRYADAQVVRTRDPAILETCDIVVDVGGVFDPARHRYDHHQKHFNESMSSLVEGKPWTTKLSSAGLVYAFFGKEIIAHLLGNSTQGDLIERIYDKVYENFVEEVDAVDNGINTHDAEARYKISTTLGSRVSYLRPAWNDPGKDMDQMFWKAVKLTWSEFQERVHFYANVWWPARSIVTKALNERFNLHPSGQIIELEASGCPFTEHLYELETELGVEKPILFALFQDGTWRVRAVSIQNAGFALRQGLPLEWRGLRDDTLSRVAGIEGCVFVHSNGFIGGATSRQGALQMAIKGLESNVQHQ